MENIERQPPLLLISHGKGYEKHTFRSLLEKENSDRTTNIPELNNKDIFGSNYGWLVLVDKKTNYCCLWNPILDNIIHLPEFKDAFLYNTCVLSKPPTDPDCHILFNSSVGVHQSFLKIGDEDFRMQSLHDHDIKQLLAVGSFDGKIYGLTRTQTGDRFVSIHFDDGEALEFRQQLWHIPQRSRLWLSRPWVSWLTSYLIESSSGRGDQFLWIYKMRSHSYENEFRVFQVDTNRMECIELDTLGERTIFLTYFGGGFCCSSVGNINPNSVYYIDEDSRVLNVYDLYKRSTTSLFSCSSRRYKSLTFWVDPQVIHKHLP